MPNDFILCVHNYNYLCKKDSPITQPPYQTLYSRIKENIFELKLLSDAINACDETSNTCFGCGAVNQKVHPRPHKIPSQALPVF